MPDILNPRQDIIGEQDGMASEFGLGGMKHIRARLHYLTKPYDIVHMTV